MPTKWILCCLSAISCCWNHPQCKKLYFLVLLLPSYQISENCMLGYPNKSSLLYECHIFDFVLFAIDLDSSWHMIVGGKNTEDLKTVELYNWKTKEQCKLGDLPLGILLNVNIFSSHYWSSFSTTMRNLLVVNYAKTWMKCQKEAITKQNHSWN